MTRHLRMIAGFDRGPIAEGVGWSGWECASEPGTGRRKGRSALLMHRIQNYGKWYEFGGVTHMGSSFSMRFWYRSGVDRLTNRHMCYTGMRAGTNFMKWHMHLAHDRAGQLTLYGGDQDWMGDGPIVFDFAAEPGGIIKPNTWQFIELTGGIGPADETPSGYYMVAVDGSVKMMNTNADTLTGNNGLPILWYMLGDRWLDSSDMDNLVAYYSDFSADDGDVADPPLLRGPSEVVLKVPSAPGDAQEWAIGRESIYDRVPAYNYVEAYKPYPYTWLYAPLDGVTDLYRFSHSGLSTVGEVTAVQLSCAWSPASGDYVRAVVSNGTTTVTLPLGNERHLVMELNPITGSAWTLEEVDTYQYGLYCQALAPDGSGGFILPTCTGVCLEVLVKDPVYAPVLRVDQVGLEYAFSVERYRQRYRPTLIG